MDALSQALYEFAEEMEDTTVGSGEAWLKGLRIKSLQKIEEGEAKSIISATFGNQSTSEQVDVSAERMFVVVSEALRELKGEAISMTYPMFPAIPH